MSVYKRRGRWFCDVTIDGRRAQRVLKKARTRAQAIKATAVIENKLFENRYKTEKRREVRFDKFVKDSFLPYSKLHKRTYPDDVKICDMFFETFGQLMLSDINPPLIEKFKQKRLEGKTMYKRKRNPATVNRELCVLSKLFSLAFDAELIDSNPCRRVRKFRTDCGRTRYLTFEEEAKLFEQLQGHEWVQRIVTMAINNGMRQGEIFDLTWFDVDLPRGVIHIRVSKNGKDRFVPINQTVRKMLEGLLHTSEYVFPSRRRKGVLSMLSSVLIRRRMMQESETFVFTTCVIQPLAAWRTAEPMRSRWLKSSDGQMFEWLSATLTRPTRRSEEQLKTWFVRMN
ncbi:hypothetical protein BH20ACI3_BH20ACI3_22300 [soil metagenome]